MDPQSLMNLLDRLRRCVATLGLLAWAVCAWLICGGILSNNAAAVDASFEEVNQVLTTHCAGCHNDSDESGDFSLSSYAKLMAGIADGRSVIVPGKPDESLLLRLMTGEDEPLMPPEQESRPTDSEIDIVRKWIAGGAVAEAHSSDMPKLAIPKLQPAPETKQFLSAAASVRPGQWLVGEMGKVHLQSSRSPQPLWTLDDLAGKVNTIRIAPDGKTAIIGSGLTGVAGEILIVDLRGGEVLQTLRGHSDAVYCATLSSDGRHLASGSYDRKILLWNVETGQVVRELSGHNGAIYDLDFSPDGRALASASADQTVKLWNVETGARLDTFGQPEGEMRCVRFSPDGDFVFAGGSDRQIRKWEIVSAIEPAINPMVAACFAHEAGVLQIEFASDGVLLSASEDRTVKAWDAGQLHSLGQLLVLDELPVALAVPRSDDAEMYVFELRGQQRRLPPAVRKLERLVVAESTSDRAPEVPNELPNAVVNSELPDMREQEPNDTPEDAGAVDLPIECSGTISPAGDADLFRFTAKAGERWLLEVKAAENSSPLDSFIDVLSESGEPVVRTRLQAVRESYFTFRGKDSSTSDDYRMHKWEDMELDEYLYSNGEVNRLWLYPRGPDSGFKVYPGFGSRYAFFGTTPVSHALGEPAYIVRELGPQESALPNGLPVFPIYFENDDDPARRAGADSRLNFVAPASGTYLVRVRDARGFGGDDYSYQLAIRKPQPDFELKVSGEKMSMPMGSGREWKVEVVRIDGMDSAIEIELLGLPAGFEATNPLIIEAGQQTALGTVYASETNDVPLPKTVAGEGKSNPADGEKSQTATIQLVARAVHEGREIRHEMEESLELKIIEAQEIQMVLVDAADRSRELESLTIRPGQTISARILVERNGEENRISFGNDDSGRNLPHGAFVDNIGLNGLLIPEGQSEREFFITAAPKLQPGRRQFHLRSGTSGNPTSRPIWLEVLPARDR